MPLADSFEAMELVQPVDTPTTISEHLLAALKTVQAVGHTSKQASHYELAFLDFVSANGTKLDVVMAILARRRQFVSDAVVADFATAIYFLEHNGKYIALDKHDRDQALLLYKKSQEDKSLKTVTAIIQQAPPSRPRHNANQRSSQGWRPSQHSYNNSYNGNNSQNNANSNNNSYNNNNNNNNNNNHQNNNNNNRPPPATPQHTRSGNQYNNGGRN
jgi:hypothetical protein